MRGLYIMFLTKRSTVIIKVGVKDAFTKHRKCICHFIIIQYKHFPILAFKKRKSVHPHPGHLHDLCAMSDLAQVMIGAAKILVSQCLTSR